MTCIVALTVVGGECDYSSTDVGDASEFLLLNDKTGAYTFEDATIAEARIEEMVAHGFDRNHYKIIEIEIRQ
jgi:hypothetical protein